MAFLHCSIQESARFKSSFQNLSALCASKAFAIGSTCNRSFSNPISPWCEVPLRVSIFRPVPSPICFVAPSYSPPICRPFHWGKSVMGFQKKMLRIAEECYWALLRSIHFPGALMSIAEHCWALMSIAEYCWALRCFRTYRIYWEFSK